MRFAFFGTPEFAAIILEDIISAGFPPTIIIANPDKPTGRRKIVTPPPSKKIAEKYGIQVWQPEKIDIDAWHANVPEVDFSVVAAYAKILPQQIVDAPRLGTVGVHPSLLPKYRGASPIQSVILNGETETGVTLYLMDEKVDHGPSISNVKTQISNLDTTELLIQRLAELAGGLLIKTLPKFLAGEIVPEDQDHAKATFTKKLRAEDAYIDPEDLLLAESEGRDAELILRKIHALNPEPGVWTMRDGKRLKLLDAEILVGKLRLKKIQWEGGKPVLQ